MTAAAVLLTLSMIPPFEAMTVDYVPLSVSAYVNDPIWGNVAKSGKLLRNGHCACGPSYEFYTLFVLPDGTVLECQDRGPAITDMHLDIWTDNLRWALDDWGRRDLDVYVIQ